MPPTSDAQIVQWHELPSPVWCPWSELHKNKSHAHIYPWAWEGHSLVTRPQNHSNKRTWVQLA